MPCLLHQQTYIACRKSRPVQRLSCLLLPTLPTLSTTIVITCDILFIWSHPLIPCKLYLRCTYHPAISHQTNPRLNSSVVGFDAPIGPSLCPKRPDALGELPCFLWSGVGQCARTCQDVPGRTWGATKYPYYNILQHTTATSTRAGNGKCCASEAI